MDDEFKYVLLGGFGLILLILGMLAYSISERNETVRICIERGNEPLVCNQLGR